MNIYKLIIFCSAVLLFSSCGKDLSDKIIGDWILTDLEVLPGCNEPEIELLVVQNGCVIEGGDTFCISISFSEDGMGVINADNDIINLTYTVNEDTEVIKLCDGLDCNDLTLNGDELKLILMEDECEIAYIFKK